MNQQNRRPLPVPDADSAPFWQAAAQHVLTLARCSQCGEMTLPPDVICPNCLTTTPAFTFVPVSGSGKVRTWTVMRHSFLPGMASDIPFVLVDVQLDEHPKVRMIGRLLDGPDAPLAIGTPVTIAFEDVAPGVSIPAFHLASAR